MQPIISIIILAAGSSTRLGTPKQLINYQGKSLLQRITETALRSKANSVNVLLGSQFSIIKKEISDLPVNIIENPNWHNGISTSIIAGIKSLPPTTDATILLLCDQPKITSSLLNTMIDAFLKSNKPIVACKYGNTIGVPALFDKSIFPELLQLKGDSGAKKIIMNHKSATILIDFPDGIYDIDSPIDQQSIN